MYLLPFIFLALDYFWIYDSFWITFTSTAISAPTTITSPTPAAVAALVSTTAGSTSAAAAPTAFAAMPAAAAALGKLRRYHCERRMSTMLGSQFCLFWSFFRLSGRGVVLIFDVQFPEYLSITILTVISFSMKI